MSTLNQKGVLDKFWPVKFGIFLHSFQHLGVEVQSAHCFVDQNISEEVIDVECVALEFEIVLDCWKTARNHVIYDLF